MWSAEFDGNNVLDAWAATRLATERCRQGQGPAMLIAETFRMGGHATHDEREARETFSAELVSTWGKRDPIGLYGESLQEEGRTAQQLEAGEAGVTAAGEHRAGQAVSSRQTGPWGRSTCFGASARICM